MAPKVDVEMRQDIADMKASLTFLCKSIEEIQKSNKVNDGKIADLLKAMQIKDQKIEALEFTVTGLVSKVEELEQYSRIDNVIISGLHVSAASYARAAGGADEEGGLTTNDSVEIQVIKFFGDKMNVTVAPSDISACHQLPTTRKVGSERTQKKNIIVKFTNRKTKDEILRNGKLLKGSQVYVNEHLTKKTGDLAKLARDLRRENKVASTWTRNCKVFVRSLGAPEVANTYRIGGMDDLNRFK